MTLTEWKAAIIARYGANGVRFERHPWASEIYAYVLRTKVGTYNTETGEAK